MSLFFGENMHQLIIKPRRWILHFVRKNVLLEFVGWWHVISYHFCKHLFTIDDWADIVEFWLWKDDVFNCNEIQNRIYLINEIDIWKKHILYRDTNKYVDLGK